MDNFTDDELLSLSYSTLGEALRFQAQTDEIIFEQPEKFAELMEKAKEAYKKASSINPENEFAQYRGKGDKRWESEQFIFSMTYTLHNLKYSKKK